MAATMYKIRQSVGQLHVIDARAEPGSPLLLEIRKAGLDLDLGMVIKYQNKLYHGDAALEIMAKIGSDKGLYNRINSLLFKSKTLSQLCYPIMKTARDIAIWAKGVGKIRNLD